MLHTIPSSKVEDSKEILVNLFHVKLCRKLHQAWVRGKFNWVSWRGEAWFHVPSGIARSCRRALLYVSLLLFLMETNVLHHCFQVGIGLEEQEKKTVWFIIIPITWCSSSTVAAPRCLLASGIHLPTFSSKDALHSSEQSWLLIYNHSTSLVTFLSSPGGVPLASE